MNEKLNIIKVLELQDRIKQMNHCTNYDVLMAQQINFSNNVTEVDVIYTAKYGTIDENHLHITRLTNYSISKDRIYFSPPNDKNYKITMSGGNIRYAKIPFIINNMLVIDFGDYFQVQHETTVKYMEDNTYSNIDYIKKE